MSERDHRKRTPAGGVRQLDDHHHDDPIETLRAVVRRSRDSEQAAKHTLDRVDGLRSELGRRIDSLDLKVDSVDGKVDELAVGHARIEGALEVLNGHLARRLDAESAVHVSARTARIEIEKTGELAKIDERKARNAWLRDIGLKILAAGGVLSWLATALAKGC